MKIDSRSLIKVLFVLCACAGSRISLASATAKPIENIVKNGGFEQDAEKFAHWETEVVQGVHPRYRRSAPAEAFIDTNVYKQGRQSLALRFASSREGISQQIDVSKYAPDSEYVFSFWFKTKGDATCRVILGISRSGHLARNNVAYQNEWKYFREVFQTPKAARELILQIQGRASSSASAMLWIDDVSIHPNSDQETDAVAVLNALEDEMLEFGASDTVRGRDYRLETDIDMLKFDVNDFKAYDIVNAAEYKALKERVSGLYKRRKAAGIHDFPAAFRDGRDSIILRRAWDEARELADAHQGWKQEWEQEVELRLSPIEKKVAAMRRDIKANVASLRKHRRERDRRIAAAEREAFAEDYDEAIEALASDDPRWRKEGALELGRLEDERAVPALIMMLDDPYYPARRNALYALAWMRSREAVPAIMDLAEAGGDPWTRRRAVQALGQIGDLRASSLLQSLIADDDGAVRQNAIISLGWLRDRSAVPILTDVVEQCLLDAPRTFEWLLRERDADKTFEEVAGHREPCDRDRPTPWAQRPVMRGGWKIRLAINNSFHTAELAVQSLGLIGDPDAKPLLKKLVETQQWTVRNAAIFALGQMGDASDVELLKEWSAARPFADTLASRVAGGRTRTALRRNALYALDAIEDPVVDAEPGIRQPDFTRQKRYFYWVDNHFHRAFGRWLSAPNQPQDFEQAMRYAGASGARANQIMEWHTPEPLSEAGRWFDAAHDNALRCLIAEIHENGKGQLLRKIHYFGAYPAFAGVWHEEGPYVFLDDMRDRMRELDPDLLQQITRRRYVDPDFRLNNREFFARYAEIIEQNVLDGMQEEREFLHMLRKGAITAHYTSVGASTFTGWVGLSLWGRMAHHLDISGTEPSYSTATYENAMFAEMCRDGRDDIVTGMEIYIWRLPRQYTRRWEVGMGISLLHARQFYVWYWGDVFKQLNSEGRGRPEAWDITVRMFNKMHKLEPYLAGSQRPKDFAIVYSGRTSALLYRDNLMDEEERQTARENLYTRNNIGIFQALAYEHTQSDVIWADTMTQDSIRDYKTLMLAGAKTMTPEQEDILRKWVAGGGTLIATGTATLFDQHGIERANYGLADVFGVDFIKNTCTIPLENIDSGAGIGPEEIDTFAFGDHTVEYNLAYGYDVVSPHTAEILSAWNGSGDPAVTFNEFGEGHSLFVAATYPGKMNQGGRRIYRWPLFKHYSKGITEMLAELVRRGLELTGTSQPWFIDNCPWHVEANLQLQPEKKRMLFQLLNYDEQKIPVSGVQVRLRVPGRVSTVRYGDDNRDIPFSQDGEYVAFDVRDFDIHEAIVVAYEP